MGVICIGDVFCIAQSCIAHAQRQLVPAPRGQFDTITEGEVLSKVTTPLVGLQRRDSKLPPEVEARLQAGKLRAQT